MLASGGDINWNLETGFTERANQVAEGQTDDTGKTAAEVYHRMEAVMLDGIGTGFIERVAGGNVDLNFQIAVISHGDIYLGNICDNLTSDFVDDSKPGENLMGPAPELL